MAVVLVNTGHAITTNRMIGSGTEPKYIGWATGAGTSVVADTALDTEVDVDVATGTGTRTTGTSSRVTTTNANDTYQVTGTRTATGAGTIKQLGSWDNSAMGSGNLYVSGNVGPYTLAIGDSVTPTIKVKFA